jgi:hypothetical protein
VEIKNQSESKFGHPEPLDHGKPPHTTLHWENLVLFLIATATTATTGSKPAYTSIDRANRWAPHTTQNSPIYPLGT